MVQAMAQKKMESRGLGTIPCPFLIIEDNNRSDHHGTKVIGLVVKQSSDLHKARSSIHGVNESADG